MSLVFTEQDFQQLSRFDGQELVRLYRFLVQRMQAPPMDAVVTVRLGPDAVQKVKEIAVRRGLTRSDVVREAVTEYVRRNPL